MNKYCLNQATPPPPHKLLHKSRCFGYLDTSMNVLEYLSNANGNMMF